MHTVQNIGKEEKEGKEIYQEITNLKIVASVGYYGRVLSLVEFMVGDVAYRTIYYRSTGTNVVGRGKWFPCAGLAASNEMSTTGMHVGWINKAYIYSSKDGIELYHSYIRSEREHSDPRIRLANTTFGMQPTKDKPMWSIEEVSAAIQEVYSDENPTLINLKGRRDVPKIEFINTLLLTGLEELVETPDPESEMVTKEIAQE